MIAATAKKKQIKQARKEALAKIRNSSDYPKRSLYQTDIDYAAEKGVYENKKLKELGLL